MSRCRNDVVMNKIGVNKVSKTTEVDFSIIEDVESCVKVSTKNHTSFFGASAIFNKYSVPNDELNCLKGGCHNSGTLYVTPEEETASASFSIREDATEFAAGIVTYYMNFAKEGTYDVITTISDIKDEQLNNSDVYTKEIVVNELGFYPVLVDLSEVPNNVGGDGWLPSEDGINITIRITNTEVVGISSISIFGSSEDLEVNNVVKVGCLSEISGDYAIGASESTCFGVGYDETTVSIEKTIVGSSVTPNYWLLNPLISKGEKTEGYQMVTKEEMVKSTAINGIDYGYIQTADMYMDECGYIAVTLDDNCNVTDAMLRRLTVPTPIAINEKQFIVLDGTRTSIQDAGKILLNAELIGKKVVVSYPKKTEVEHFIATDENLNARRVRMTYTKKQSDGVEIRQVFNNVLVTSFPDSITAEETTFSFTISIQRDNNGRFFEEFRIM